MNVDFSSGNIVFKGDGTGTLTRVAGTGTPGYSGDSGPATEAQLNQPKGVAVDAGGALYIADSGNGLVRKVTPDGVIVTMIATIGRASAGVAVDLAGNLYMSDTGNCTVREVTDGGATWLTVAETRAAGFRATEARPPAPSSVPRSMSRRTPLATSISRTTRRA